MRKNIYFIFLDGLIIVVTLKAYGVEAFSLNWFIGAIILVFVLVSLRVFSGIQK